MKDYIKEYKRQKSKKNIVIIASSLVFALWMNAFLFWTPVWTKLQTSVKNFNTVSTDKEVISDLYLTQNWSWSDMLSLKSWAKMNNVSELRLSIVSDPVWLKINNIISEDNSYELIKSSIVPWVYYVVLKFKTPKNIESQDTLFKIVYTKQIQDKTSVNLSETQFVSGEQTYELQSGSIEF